MKGFQNELLLNDGALISNMDFALTIAGADPSSGAGIQADIRTFDRCGIHAFSAITAITYQSATHFQGFKSLSDELENQLKTILNNYPVKYVKIGMIPDSQCLKTIVSNIKRYDLFAVLDPVSISSAGARLASEGLEQEIEQDLFPLVKILTPNITEARFYSNMDLEKISEENINELKDAASIILNKMQVGDKEEEKAVIIKSGGSKGENIFDLVLINQKFEDSHQKAFKLYEKRKIDITGNIHGTGCVFSSAITAFLTKGYSIEDSITEAELFFDQKFQNYILLPDKGKIINLTISQEKLDVIKQIKQIYNFISDKKQFSKVIPEVRMNISGSLTNPTDKNDIAGIDGRITIINGYPKASGDIKFGVSDHTARLILTAKQFDNSINFVMNLKYSAQLIHLIKEKTNLTTHEFVREVQPEDVRKKEHSTMQWLIREYIETAGQDQIPDIIWDDGARGKEPMIRLFGRNSSDMIVKLQKILNLL